MHYCRYYSVDVVNGPGTRCTLFVSGCTHQCRGCYNQSTWRFDSGMPFDQALSQQIIDDLSDTDIPRRGLSLSGGDPLHPNNVPDVLELVKRVRRECSGKDIWCWTGYEIEQLSDLQWQLVKLIDVLIDGRFEQDKLSAELPWQGSSNQRIIHIDDWLKKNMVSAK